MKLKTKKLTVAEFSKLSFESDKAVRTLRERIGALRKELFGDYNSDKTNPEIDKLTEGIGALHHQVEDEAARTLTGEDVTKWFKVIKGSKAGKIMNRLSRYVVGHQRHYFDVGHTYEGNDVEACNVSAERWDGCYEGGWGGPSYSHECRLPVNGFADVYCYEYELQVGRPMREATEGDLMDNFTVQTVDGKIVRWWLMTASGKATELNMKGKDLSDEVEEMHAAAININERNLKIEFMTEEIIS